MCYMKKNTFVNYIEQKQVNNNICFDNLQNLNNLSNEIKDDNCNCNYSKKSFDEYHSSRQDEESKLIFI